MARKYLVYDVFTERAMAGNPLAILLDCDGLDTAAMQAIAREFNLSETVFVLPPDNAMHRARLRIFTPAYELPFAGHPTVGTAVALAEEAGGTAGIFVLEEEIGPVRCAVTSDGDAAFAEFDLPQLSQSLPLGADPAAIAAALGLGPHETGFENHAVGQWSAGVPYVTIPVAGLEQIAKARLDNDAWLDLAPRREQGMAAAAYVYCRESIHHDSAFHARMFVPGNPSYEDPATGSAAAAFSGTLLHFDRPIDGAHSYWIEQGFEMGRPSRIRLAIDVKAAAAQTTRIGGHAVRIAEGILHS